MACVRDVEWLKVDSKVNDILFIHKNKSRFLATATGKNMNNSKSG